MEQNKKSKLEILFVVMKLLLIFISCVALFVITIHSIKNDSTLIEYACSAVGFGVIGTSMLFQGLTLWDDLNKTSDKKEN